MPTADAWSRGALRSHLGVSLLAFVATRDAMLVASETGDGPEMLGQVQGLTAQLERERDWLKSLAPVPDRYSRHPRAAFLAMYGDACLATLRELNEGLRAAARGDSDWEPFARALRRTIDLQRASSDLP